MERVGIMPARFIFLKTKTGAEMISAEERQKNECIYKMAWAVVRDMYLRKEISKTEAKRLNQKNAEKMGCKVIPID